MRQDLSTRRRFQHLVTTGLAPIGENSRANDDPIEAALANQRFLYVLVGIGASKDQAESEALQPADACTAVAGTEARYADQPSNAGCRHCGHDHSGRLGKEPDRAENQCPAHWYSKRKNDRVHAAQRGGDVPRVERIAGVSFQIRIGDCDVCCRSGEGAYYKAARQCRLDGFKSDAAAGADDQDLLQVASVGALRAPLGRPVPCPASGYSILSASKNHQNCGSSTLSIT